MTPPQTAPARPTDLALARQCDTVRRAVNVAGYASGECQAMVNELARARESEAKALETLRQIAAMAREWSRMSDAQLEGAQAAFVEIAEEAEKTP